MTNINPRGTLKERRAEEQIWKSNFAAEPIGMETVGDSAEEAAKKVSYRNYSTSTIGQGNQTGYEGMMVVVTILFLQLSQQASK